MTIVFVGLILVLLSLWGLTNLPSSSPALPTVTITLTPEGRAFDGVAYYTAPQAVTPLISASPKCTIVATVNRKPYTPGSPISGEGHYVLSAYAIGPNGERGPGESRLFMITKYRRAGARITVEQFAAERPVTTAEVAVVLESDDFQPDEVRADSVNLWLMDSTGSSLNTEKIWCDSHLVMERALELRFAVKLSKSIPYPALIEINGMGQDEKGWFDFSARCEVP